MSMAGKTQKSKAVPYCSEALSQLAIDDLFEIVEEDKRLLAKLPLIR